MRRSARFVGASVLLLGATLTFDSACRSKPQEAPPPQAGAPEYAPIASIKDIMDSMVDPSADVVWEAVSTIVDKSGRNDRVPKNDEEWHNVRLGALRVVEGANLLMMPGRHVARPHEKSDTPGVELEPDVIEANINKDRAKFNLLATGLRNAAVEALRAIEAKNAAAVVDAGEKIDEACENCHVTYWYPNQPLPESSPR